MPNPLPVPPIPPSYPHSAARFEADLKRATEYLVRGRARQQSARTYRIVIRHEPMHRDIGYTIKAADSLSANLAALELAGGLGPEYRVMRVEEFSRG